jgi:hypothetical protein
MRSIFLFCFIILISCSENRPALNSGPIKLYFIDTNDLENKSTVNQLTTRVSNDSINSNLKFDYCKAVSFLQNKFYQIDSCSENESTKKYLKVSILAEFVYASFSFQFFGEKSGKTSHRVAIKNWDKLPLDVCYNIANNNLLPVWCGDRTTFFIRLLDSLLSIKAKAISIKNIHTFPLVSIGQRRFIFDPYDPFIIFDSSLSEILDYDQVQKLVLKKDAYKVTRTKRLFGFANELISQQLAFDILNVPNKKVSDFSQKLDYYLFINKSNLFKGIEMCSFETFNRTGMIHPCNLKNDKYVISLVDNLNNKPMNLNHFKKYYLGINCK